jgi:hypothetical protein
MVNLTDSRATVNAPARGERYLGCAQAGALLTWYREAQTGGRIGPQRDTEASPGTQNLQRFSVATRMPIRLP